MLGVLYRCNKDDCTIREDDIAKIESYHLYFHYQGVSIDHQNDSKPIQPLPNNTY